MTFPSGAVAVSRRRSPPVVAISDPHRYWRFLLTQAKSGSNYGATQINMYETIGGTTNVATGGTAIAGNYQTVGENNPPANAFDNISTTKWNTGGSFTAAQTWVGYDFGAGNAKDIVEFDWYGRNDIYGLDQNPRSGMLQYSDDGTTWTTKFKWYSCDQFLVYPAYVKINAVEQQSSTPLDPNAKRYWRLNWLENQSNTTTVNAASASEIQFRGVASGPNLLLNAGVALIDDGKQVSSSYAPAKAIDGLTTTFWCTTNLTADVNRHYLGADFGVGVDINIAEIVLTKRDDQYGANEAIKTASLQWSNDKVRWKNQKLILEEPIWAAGPEVRTYTITA